MFGHLQCNIMQKPLITFSCPYKSNWVLLLLLLLLLLLFQMQLSLKLKLTTIVSSLFCKGLFTLR